MLTRTRSKTLSISQPADSTSEDDLLSSQSQFTSDVLTVSSVDSHSGPIDTESAAPLADLIALEAATAVIHIHCPTGASDTAASSAIDLTADESVGSAAVSWAEVAAQSVVHVLPCSIHYNGPAAVQRYFHPEQAHNPTLTATAATVTQPATTYISAAAPTADQSQSALADSRWYSAAFRGRLLTGEKVSLPLRTVGLVVREANGGRTRLLSSVGSNGGAKRHRMSRPPSRGRHSASAADDECVVVDDDVTHASSSTVAGGGEGATGGAHIDWVVDGWFDAVTLWGRDSDWKGVDQSRVKQSLLEWPAIAAALHDTHDAPPLAPTVEP